MKPSNLLLNSDCLMKVADFGLARSLPETRIVDPSPLTDYVATRWYRAPEILLGSGTYHFAVDMWAVGCILGEMLVGKPIFPGTSTMNQLEKITSLVGCPPRDDVAKLSPFAQSMLFSDTIKGTTSYPCAHSGHPFTSDEAADGQRPEQAARRDDEVTARFQKEFPSATDDAIHLLIHLMQFDPKKRISAETALEHPYIAQFHDPSVERTANRAVRPIIPDDEKKSTNFYREQLYAQINISNKKSVQDSRRGPVSGRSGQ